MTVAGSALSSKVGTAGSVLASTAKVVGGLKTLALLGIIDFDQVVAAAAPQIDNCLPTESNPCVSLETTESREGASLETTETREGKGKF